MSDAYAGLAPEEFFETIAGLTANTEYAVCLVVETPGGDAETATTFKTPVTPEKPTTVSPAKEITATTAKLEGTLNPLKVGEAGTYEFYAQQSATECNREHFAPEPAGTMTGAKEQKVSATVTGLEPNAEYTFCLEAINKAGETVAGNAVHFTTKPAPPEVTEAKFSGVKATEVTLEGTVNPNNEPTECKFEYGMLSFSEGEIACSPELLKGYGPQNVSSTKLGEQGQPVASITGLTPETTYKYRIVTNSGAGEGTGEGTFETALPPNTPEKAGATGITATTATLNGFLNPTAERTKDLGTYEFVYRQSSTECRYARSAEEIANLEAEIEAARKLKEGDNSVKNQETLSEKKAERRSDEAKEAENKSAPQEAAPGAQGQAVNAEVTELTPGAAPYTFCLLVHNEAGEEAIGPPETFTTLAVAPAIKSESASVIESAGATLNAEIVPEGAATTTHFEYLSQAQFEADGKTFGAGTLETSESGSIGSDDAEHLASVRIPAAGQPALEPSTTYHFRVVATNSQGTAVGVLNEHGEEIAETFTTTPAPGSETSQGCTNEQRRTEQPYGLGLPDCRAYEMVSPLETNGNDATEPSYIGNLLATGRVRASEDAEQEVGGEAVEPAITYGARGGFSGAAGSALEYQVLSRREPVHERWSTRSITAPREEASLDGGYEGVFFTPQLSQGLAEIHGSLPGSAAPPGFMELYHANFPENLDVPISYQLVSRLPPGKEEYTKKYNVGEAAVQPVGASSDLGHVAFEPGLNPVFGASLYESAAGHVVQVGVSNAGEDWSVNAGYHTGVAVSVLQDVWHAMSADGSRVVFTRIEEAGNQLAEATKGLYVRVNGGVKVEPEPEREQSKMKGETCEEPAKACTVEIASGPARYWGANTEDTKIFYTENGNLYEYELPIGSVKGQTTALTHEGEVQGVAQISEKGSYVYFVANAELKGPHEEALRNSLGKEPKGGKPNLYVSHEGTLAFIATLSASDEADWSTGPEQNQAVVSPQGNRLAFTSEASLTGYDNHPAEPKECEGEPATGIREGGTCLEVYLYHAPANLATETGTLACASCNPSGARPVGGAALSEGGGGARSGDYRPRALLQDGALFFDSSDALVPHASDGRQNVYEFEDGHVYPISNVAGGQESFFLDASPDGQDVFFGSADQLLPEDTGNNVVVWDAREDGGFPVTAAAPACTTAEACRTASPPTPGIYGAGPSETFAGPGNFAPPSPAVVKKVTTKKPIKCKRNFVKNKKGQCIKKKKSKKAKKAKRASRNRRGK